MKSLQAALMVSVLVLGSLPLPAVTASPPIARIVVAADAFLGTLNETQKKQVVYAFDDAEQRVRWSNLPVAMVPRGGMSLKEMSAPQKAAALKLLAATLSPAGFEKIQQIMEGDEVLQQQGGRRNSSGPMFGRDIFYISMLGKPSDKTPWILQFGGHHLAINLTLAGSQASMTPSLPAAQPAKFEWEGRTVRPLGSENDKAFALVNALDEKQKGQAILGSRVADLVLGPGQDGKTIQPEGIRASALSAAQQNMLWDVVREWSGIMADSFAEPRLAEIKSHLNDTYFAWSGPTTNGSVIYYRIQGPTLVIEYAPQKSVDHIHTIYRDPTNDYGKKIAAR